MSETNVREYGQKRPYVPEERARSSGDHSSLRSGSLAPSTSTGTTIDSYFLLPASPEVWRKRGIATRRRRDRYADVGCRVVNVLAAALGLTLTLPLMILIACLVRSTSRGSVIYTQLRVGLDRRDERGDGAGGEWRRRRDTGGRLFTIYKFRTMYQTESGAEQVWASKGDPRVTPVGKVLRKYRLDELPQLFNVLKGDMNLVGPRPEQPEIFQELRQELDGYESRQKVLPGITGWAQINHHYDQCIADVQRKVQLDLQYMERRSALEDLKIMAWTVPVVLLKHDGW